MRAAHSARLALSLLAWMAGDVSHTAAADWPQWRGPDRTALSPETGLLQQWPADGPRLLWTQRDLGFGYGAPAVVGDRLYILGTEGESAVALAIDAGTGERVWATRLSDRFEDRRGAGPRSTPTVDGQRLYALDAVGKLFCLDSQSGQEVWSKSLVEDFGGDVP